MRYASFTAAMMVLAVCSIGAGQQQPTFRGGAATVAVYVRVADRSGRLVPGLQQADFQILEDGRRVEIQQFSSDPQPLAAVMLLDMSVSMVTSVLRVRDAARAFVEAVRPGDRVRIGTFGTEIAISPQPTDRGDTLRRVLQEELWPGGGTPLWNALHEAMTVQEAETGRRVVLVLTDGVNSTNLPDRPGTPEAVEQKAISDDFMLYAIGLEGSPIEGRLVRLVNQTGGAHFEVKRNEDLGVAFARVADELRGQYLLGFTPARLDNKLHRIEVRVQRAGLTARARRSYLAAAR
jgi:Ca-activated chloride channel family protein